MAAVSLFLHSTGTTPAMWAGVPGEVLGSTTKLAPTHLGYPPHPTVARGERAGATQDADYVLSQVPDDASEVHLFAHSYGGVVALDLLARPQWRDRVRSVFLYEPVMFGALAHTTRTDVDREAIAEAKQWLAHPWFVDDETRGGTEEWLDLFIDYWNRPGAYANMPEKDRAFLRQVGWKMSQEVRSCFLAIESFEFPELASIPTTLVMGERSPRTSRAMVQALASEPKNGNPLVVDLPKTGHMGPLTHAALVHEALVAHARRVGVGR